MSVDEITPSESSDRLTYDFENALPKSFSIDIENAKGKKTSLSLVGCSSWVDDKVITDVARIGFIQSVNFFRCCRITDRGIYELVNNNSDSLESIGLAGCSHVSDKALKYIGSKCMSLTYLDLTRCPLITDIGINYLERISGTLETLLLYANSQLGTSTYYLIASSFKNILRLDLCGHSNLTSHDLCEILNSCSKIEYLNLSWCISLDDAFIDQIVKKQQLTHLKTLSLFGINNLSRTPLVNFMTYLSTLPTLVELDIRGVVSVADYSDNDSYDLRRMIPGLKQWKLHT